MYDRFPHLHGSRPAADTRGQFFVTLSLHRLGAAHRHGARAP
ncbi:hypothetical protein [Bordetella sp. N]|nr:hypothetical protein [Bordetella sp. N]